jgi:hypothetical protein
MPDMRLSGPGNPSVSVNLSNHIIWRKQPRRGSGTRSAIKAVFAGTGTAMKPAAVNARAQCRLAKVDPGLPGVSLRTVSAGCRHDRGLWRRVTGGRLSDWISLAVLACCVSRDAVEEAVETAGKTARRKAGSSRRRSWLGQEGDRGRSRSRALSSARARLRQAIGRSPGK